MAINSCLVKNAFVLMLVMGLFFIFMRKQEITSSMERGLGIKILLDIMLGKSIGIGTVASGSILVATSRFISLTIFMLGMVVMFMNIAWLRSKPWAESLSRMKKYIILTENALIIDQKICMFFFPMALIRVTTTKKESRKKF